MQTSKELIVKFVKGVALFVVFCLAVFGAYTLFKPQPQLNVSEKDISYLEDLGISVQDGQAADSGLSGVLGDVQGVAPVGSSAGTPSSSAPPSHFAEPVSSYADPFEAAPPLESAPTFDAAPPFEPAPVLESAPPFEPAPRVAEVDTALITPLNNDVIDNSKEIKVEPEIQNVPALNSEFSSSESVTLSTLNDYSSNSTLESASPNAVSVIESQPTPPLTEPPSVSNVPLPPNPSPPPEWETWNGPASAITVTPPPVKLLQSTQSPADAAYFSPANEQVAQQQPERSIRRIAPDSSTSQRPIPFDNTGSVNSGLVRGGESVAKFQAPDTAIQTGTVQTGAVQTAAVSPIQTYTQTSVRQPLTFSPAKPTVQPHAPVVTFGQPQRYTEVQSAAEPLPAPQTPPAPQMQFAQESRDTAPATALPPAEKPAAHESVVQFVQAQRQLVESGSPEKIRQAFVQLSQLYEYDSVGEPERAVMLPLLDSLALRVIYAKDSHILEAPYQTKLGDTIDSIARNYNLPTILLRKMNGLSVSQEVPAGTDLKVVYGQFDARISLKRKELTLLLGGLYAGRFVFALSSSTPLPNGGECYVAHKTPQTIELSNGWILGTADSPNATILFNGKDALELFDILSPQSVIVLE